MKKKLLLVIPTLGTGGAERLVTDICININKEIFAVTVLTFFEAENKTFSNLIKAAGINIECLKKKLGFDMSLFIKINKYFKTNTFDVISAHLNVMSYLLPTLIKLRISCYHTIHNLAEKEASGVHLRLQKYAYKKHLATPIAISEKVRESIGKLYKNSSVLINNGIDTERFVNNRNYARCSKIVCIGRLSVQKNHQLAIDAFAEIVKVYPQMYLNIYGEGELENVLQEKIEKLGLKKSVKLCGVTCGVPDVLKESDIFLLTSIYEGFGLVTCEAMSSGLPVVTTVNGGSENIVTDGVDGLFAMTAIEIFNKISALIEDSALRKRLGTNAKDKAKKFDIKVMLQSYEYLFLGQ